jgi:hypothetical protein
MEPDRRGPNSAYTIPLPDGAGGGDLACANRGSPRVVLSLRRASKLAPRGGFEPPAFPLGGGRSILLSYRGS